MCGLCGFVGRADEALVQAMTETLHHRGPDGSGVRCFSARDRRPPAALGHRRLAIIDPTPRGAQPMSYGDGRYWITYNGEIYNFRELRRTLEQQGFSFHSQCDTEVLLAMYARHGAEMLDSLNGIFGFAIWDAERGELFLARDRLGVKPLYYATADGVFYFASEVKALLPALSTPRLRHDSVADFLTFLWVPDPDTMFEGIYKLPPGHCAKWTTDGSLQVREYWDMEFAPEERSESEWVEKVREKVRESVQRQMMSDVPLGSFLSGGVDSSAVVAEMTSNGPVTTYTVGWSREDLAHEIVPDDVRYSRQFANQFNVDYHERILDPEVTEILPKLVWHMDEPVADPAGITTFLLCSAARERLTVILSGMGGDEMFGGYPRYLAMRIAQIADVLPQALRSGMRSTLTGRIGLGRPGSLRGPRRNLMKLIRGIDASFSERYLTYCSYYTRPELDAVLSPGLRGELRGYDPYYRHRDYLQRVNGEDWLNRLLYLDIKTFLPCLNLTYTDKMSMAASTEVRVPLLDDELVKLSGKIPPALKLRRMRRKYIFKRSQEGTLPRKVIWRRKAGFGAPVRSWLIGNLGPMVEEVLSPEAVSARGLLDPVEVQRVIKANNARAEDNALRIWAMLTLELWQREFIDTQPAVKPG